jgi:hypothetical protein
VHGERRIQRQCPDRAQPKSHVEGEPVFHCGERNVAQRVIDVVRQEIREENEPADQAYLADADAREKPEKCRGPRRPRSGFNFGEIHDAIWSPQVMPRQLGHPLSCIG